MNKPRVWLDSTFFADLFSNGSDAEVAQAEQVMKGLIQNYDVQITDQVLAESTKHVGQGYTKDDAVRRLVHEHQNELTVVKTETRALVRESLDKKYNHQADADLYFPQKNAGERSIIEKWQPGDKIVSNDSFFSNVQGNDRYTMRVRPDMENGLWNGITQNAHDTSSFLDIAVRDGAIHPPDHHALTQKLGTAAHRVSRGLGAANVALDVAQGNYGTASLDTAATLAENETVQDAALKGAAKLGVKEAFKLVAKHLPVIGAGVTALGVIHSTYAQAAEGNYQLAAGEFIAGTAEAAGNLVGMGDGARELARQGLIAVGGDELAQVQKSDARQLVEGAYEVGKAALTGKPEGKPVSEVLPANYRSMTQGADEMGDRSEIKRIAIERTGYAANDPHNDMGVLSQEKNRPMGHLLILEDGKVQGPESGAIDFDKNPKIAAGKNGETLGVLYAGKEAMNDAQYKTVTDIKDWLNTQRAREGITEPVTVIGGSIPTAELLHLPSPRNEHTPLVITIHPNPRRGQQFGNGM